MSQPATNYALRSEWAIREGLWRGATGLVLQERLWELSVLTGVDAQKLQLQLLVSDRPLAGDTEKWVVFYVLRNRLADRKQVLYHPCHSVNEALRMIHRQQGHSGLARISAQTRIPDHRWSAWLEGAPPRGIALLIIRQYLLAEWWYLNEMETTALEAILLGRYLYRHYGPERLSAVLPGVARYLSVRPTTLRQWLLGYRQPGSSVRRRIRKYLHERVVSADRAELRQIRERATVD